MHDKFDSESRAHHNDRFRALSYDDLLNLKIALETSQDVLEFVEDTHIFSQS